MFGNNGIRLRSNGSSINVSYNADLLIDDNEMVVSQLIQTNKGMSLFDTAPKKVKLTRPTVDSQLECVDLPLDNQKRENTHGQYIHIWSHYKFQDDDNGDGPTDDQRPSPPQPPPIVPAYEPDRHSDHDHSYPDLPRVFDNSLKQIEGIEGSKGIYRPLLNNTCYLNAVLQMIFNVVELKTPIIDCGYASIGVIAPLFQRFRNLFQDYYTPGLPRRLDASNFIKAFSDKVNGARVVTREDDLFSVNNMGDVSEFFEQLLHFIPEELTCVREQGDGTDQAIIAQRQNTINSVIASLESTFRIVCNRSKVCRSCEHSIGLPAYVSSTIKRTAAGNQIRLMEHAIYADLQDIAIVQTCEYCGANETLSVELDFIELPLILMIEAFMNIDSDGRPVLEPFSYEEVIHLHSQGVDVKYELYGVMFLKSLHYTACIRNSNINNNQWVYYDDEEIYQVGTTDQNPWLLSSRHARFVAYKRVEQVPVNAVNN